MHPEIREVLSRAWQVENDGHAFYAMVAQRTDREAVREVFEKLARDEVQHKAFLKDIASRYDREGAAAFLVPRSDPSSRTFVDRVLTDRFRAQARDADFEVSALSIGLTLESNAIALFQEQAQRASETEVRDFYRFLADWERQHYDTLRDLFQDLRRDLFETGRFEPF